MIPGMASDEMSCRLGRGISLGNALDTLREGDAGFRLRDRYFADIRDAGFDTVRLPVKWSAHASESPPYTISQTKWNKISMTTSPNPDCGSKLAVFASDDPRSLGRPLNARDEAGQNC